MHVLKSVEIHGFRGQNWPIKIKLDRHANFLIGRNGTGKTTLINLINSALSFDHQRLRREFWTKIILRFRSDNQNIVPQIEINRSSPSFGAIISFFFRESSKSEPIPFHFPARESGPIRANNGRIVPGSNRMREIEKSLNSQVGSLFNLTWLSLARADDNSVDDRWSDLQSHASDVDRKLRTTFSNLVGYFSRLDAKVAEETQEFQKHWFLSFLSQTVNFDTRVMKEINTENDQSALRAIFQKFDMAPDTFEFQLHEYFNRLRSLQNRKQEILQGWEEIGVVYDAMRLHSLVEKWQKLESAQVSTYAPKTEFINVASDLLYQKSIRVDRGNQTQIISANGLTIPIESLSSGEKQLLIFLSETLLQEGKPHIFLADEPELSLHVEWQEELVPSLLSLNPNAQVLFATHSPDIVGTFQNSIIEMERLI